MASSDNTNLIPPSPTQIQPKDQTELRKAFSEIVQAINKEFNAIRTLINNAISSLTITSGSNTNGNWVKFPDGTMEQYAFRDWAMIASGAFQSISYDPPLPFVGDAVATAGFQALTNYSTIGALYCFYELASAKYWFFGVNTTAPQTIRIKVHMIGRWK